MIEMRLFTIFSLMACVTLSIVETFEVHNISRTSGVPYSLHDETDVSVTRKSQADLLTSHQEPCVAYDPQAPCVSNEITGGVPLCVPMSKQEPFWPSLTQC